MHDETTLSLDALESALESAHVAPRDPAHEERLNRAQWEVLSGRLGIREGAREGIQTARGDSWRKWTLLGAGLGVFLLTVFGIKYIPTTQQSQIKVYTTNNGQRASLTLVDGSRVTLGPATTLRVNESRSANSPVMVDVTGEALFSITHTSNRSFTVTAHNITTRVLGTEFIVRAYDASDVRVAVRDGRVSVQSPALTANNVAILNAGEVASVTPATTPVVTQISDLATEFSWASGELVLRDMPLGEAIVRLSRWYGMEFRAADSALLQIRVEGTFPSEFSRSRIQSLANVIGARVTQSGPVITFSEVR